MTWWASLSRSGEAVVPFHAGAAGPPGGPLTLPRAVLPYR